MTWLTQLFGAKDLVREVFEGADNLFTSKGEKKELENKFEQIISDRLFKAEEIHAKDRASAREMNSSVQDSENASWLAKNTAYLIDLVLLILVIAIVVGLFIIDIPTGNENILHMSLGMVLGSFGTVIAFHRGSSSGSKEKNNIIDKLKKN